MHDLTDIERAFKDAMRYNGIVTDESIIADGNLHRFHVHGDKHSSKNGWYILFIDHIPCGKFGSWKSGLSITWCTKSKHQMTHHEWIKHCKQMTEARHQHSIIQNEKHKAAAELANEVWNMAKPACQEHPYLLKKQIPPCSARQIHNRLILPILDIHGYLWSIQFINTLGGKFLLTGGAKKGHFIPINGSHFNQQILICEGFATGATLAQHSPTACVIAAIDAGNLEPVAITIRNHYPHSEIIICADDDRQTRGNPGVTYGQHAAIAANAIFASPLWPPGSPNSLSDFNDLACWLLNSRRFNHG